MATTLLTRATAPALHTSTTQQIQRRGTALSPLRGLNSRDAFMGTPVSASPAGRTAAARRSSVQCAAAPNEMDTKLEAGLVWPKWQPQLNKPRTWFKDFPEGPAANLVMAGLRSQGLNVYDEAQIREALPKLQQYWNHFSATKLDYPEYYLEPFHVWHGNLNWPAAANSEPVMAFFNFNNLSDADKKALPDRVDAKGKVVGKQVREARALSFGKVAADIEKALGRPADEVRNIVDLGCGTGGPTRLMAHHFPNAQVLGIDASPHFLSWAVLRAQPGFAEKELLSNEVVGPRVQFRRALAEDTKLPAASQDVVLIPYVAHETPVKAREEILAEAKRILRPGGVVGFVDHNQEGSFGNRVFMQLKDIGLLGDAWHAINNFGAPELELRAYHSKYLADSLNEGGFEVVASEPVTTAQRFVAGRKV